MTSCPARAALKGRCPVFREVSCKYVCDGKRDDEVNEVDRIVAWKTLCGGECEGGGRRMYVRTFFLVLDIFSFRRRWFVLQIARYAEFRLTKCYVSSFERCTTRSPTIRMHFGVRHPNFGDSLLG
jgi:hypothetical protein